MRHRRKIAELIEAMEPYINSYRKNQPGEAKRVEEYLEQTISDMVDAMIDCGMRPELRKLVELICGNRMVVAYALGFLDSIREFQGEKTPLLHEDYQANESLDDIVGGGRVESIRRELAALGVLFSGDEKQ